MLGQEKCRVAMKNTFQYKLAKNLNLKEPPLIYNKQLNFYNYEKSINDFIFLVHDFCYSMWFCTITANFKRKSRNHGRGK